MIEAFGKADFRMAFTLTLLWQTSFYCASPFNTSYQLVELKMPFTFIMVIGFLGNMLRIAITPLMGKMGDKHGMAFLYKYSLMGIFLYHIFFALATPSNAYPMVIMGTVFSALGWSFAGIGLFGVQLELLDEGKRDVQLSVLSALSGVYGFLVSFVSGCLLDFLHQFLYCLFIFRKNILLHRDFLFLIFNDKILFLQIAPAAICRFSL